MKPKIVTISIPEYTIESQPDYEAVGSKIDRALEQNFEGEFLLRSLSLVDHPQYTLDEFVDVIINLGTDKYDPDRKGVEYEIFEPYQADIQASLIHIEDGKLQSDSYGEDVKRFYENVLLDRGYHLRIDLLTLYDPTQMTRAEKINEKKIGVDPRFEKYLWNFKDTEKKQGALVGIVKILR